MRSTGPDHSDNTRGFLPPTQQMNLVPMTEADFTKARRRRIWLWVGGIVGVLILIVVVLWRSSAPSAARSDFEDGTRLYNAGKYREAASAFTKAIAGNVNLAEAYQMRGTIHRILNEPEEAIADLTKVIEMRPDDVENYRVRAQAYRDLGKYAESLKDEDKVIQLKPSAEAYMRRGIAFRDTGQSAKAIEDFTRAIAIEPTVDNYLQRGMAYDASGDHRNAVADYDRVVELRPEMPYTYRARAFARDALGDRAGAEADRIRARTIELPPGVTSARNSP